MAGPTVGILLKSKMNSSVKKEISTYIKTISEKVQGQSFWIEGRPVNYVLGPDYPGEIDEYVALSELIGWGPKDIIGINAMCNSNIDHEKVGIVALEVAKLSGGTIAFGDLLSRYTEDTEMLSTSGLFDFANESIFTPTAFRKWLNHKDFKLVK